MGYYEPVFPTMPYGKHKGTMVDRLPETYLRWMAKSMSDPFLRVCAAAAIAGKECPEPEDCVFLDAADDGAIILIDAPYELKEDIKMLSERGWDGERKRWWIPIHGFNELMDEFPAAHPSAALVKIVGISAERKDILAAINQDAGEGALIDVGDGLQLYPYQAIATKFLDATDGKCLIADEMGCIAGDAMISLNRGEKSFKMRLEQLHQRFNSDGTGGHDWDKSIPTMARSLMSNGTFRLNRVLKVIDKGRQAVLKITTLSGRELKLTSDHEVKRPDGWTPAADLAVGNTILVNGPHVFIPKEDVIVDIEEVEPQRVYDIVMDDPGRNFIANGIVVHNCGKTIEALVWLRAHPENRPVLIVCPATMKGTWKKEVAKWLGDTNPIILKSKDTYAFDPTRNVVIINYDIMDAWKESLLYHRYNTIIIDESHHIKNEKAKRSKAVVAIAHRCKHRILLTGTPVMNRPIELFNQLNAIDPITWGSYFNFGKRYCGAHQEWVTNEKQIWMFDGATNIDELSERLKSTIMLRRTKAQVLPDLPDKSRQVIDVEIDNRKAYTKLLSDATDHYQGASIVAFTELLMTMMRGKIKPSIRYIDDVLQDVDKLVVFCTHAEMINALEEKFVDRGVVKIDGSVAVHKRTDLIDQFQTDPETHLFLGNVKAAGVGITLTAASHTVFTELPWSPMELEQAEDRLHRISQENAVNIYVLNALNTVDAHITDLIVHKKQIINMINNDMTMDDLREFTQGGDPWAV